MADKQDDKNQSQRESTEDPKVEDLAKRQDKLAEEKDKEKDPTGGAIKWKG